MLQINLCDVSASFPWLLLFQTHTSVGWSSQFLGFVWLLINSAYTAHNIIEISVRLALWTAKIIILSVPEESQITFLHLWKFHLTLLPLLFPQTVHSPLPPPPQSLNISDDQLQEKAEDHPFCTFAHCSVNFCTWVKGRIVVLGPNLEPRQALCSLWKGNIWPCTRHQNYWEQWN